MIGVAHVVYRWAVKSNDGQPTRLYGTREQARRAARRLRELDPRHTYVPAKLLNLVRKPVAEDATLDASVADHDTDFTDEIVCPHCGHEHQDSWEWGDGRDHDGPDVCGVCLRPFTWTRHISITYSTEKETET